MRRQDHIEHMGDMLNSTMFKANVVHQWEIGACIRDDAKNVQPWMEGKKHLNNILHIKFSHVNIKQCGREE